MNNIGAQDILGGKKTAANPQNEKLRPSRLEELLGKVVQTNPPKEDIFVGTKRSDSEDFLEVLFEREKIFAAATASTNKVTRAVIEQIGNALFNQGYSLSDFKKFAALDSSPQTITTLVEFFQLADINRIPNIEDIEAIKAVSRAIVVYVTTHHGDKFSNEEGTAPEWREPEERTLYIQRHEKAFKNYPKGEITVLSIGNDWAEYREADYDENFDTWLCEKYRMKILKIL